MQGDTTMRYGVIAAAILAAPLVMSTGAQAQEWCGYSATDKAVIECGYSTVADCQTATGKGGMCFVDPDYALNTRVSTSIRKPVPPGRHT
jgi:hypothetical protein